MSNLPYNGGPAFTHDAPSDEFFTGLSVRDYFAVHSTQPGMAEIIKAAGLGMDNANRVYLSEGATSGPRFDDWWGTLSLERQCELSAAVRFAQADAMLKVRQQ